MAFRYMRVALLAAGLAVGVTGGAWAGTPGYAKPGLTLSWDYSGTNRKGKKYSGSSVTTTKRAKGVVGHYSRTRNGETQNRQFVAGCSRCSDSDFSFDKKAYAGLWPLEKGKSVTFNMTRKSDGRVYVTTIKVGKLKKLKLPFGTVEAYHLIEKAQGTKGNKWKGSYNHYWAPSLGWNVKYDMKDSNGVKRKAVVRSVK